MTGFGAVLALSFVLSISSLTSNSVLKSEIDSIANEHALKVDLAGQISTGAAEMLRFENEIILRLILQDQTRSNAYKERFGTTAAKVRSLIGQMERIRDTDEAKRRLSKLRNREENWVSLHDEMIRMLDAQQFDVAQKTLAEKIVPAAEEVAQISAGTVSAVREALNQSRQTAEARQSANFWIQVVLIAISLSVGFAVLVMVRRSAMSLREQILRISDGIDQVALSAEQVSASSQVLAQGAAEQAASLGETATTSQEITSLTKKNLESAQSVAQLMLDAESNVDRMTQAFERMSGSMKEINSSSEKIARIIKVIDEIAFQTNILALNAAVEAARAGEAGSKLEEVAQAITISTGISLKVKRLADETNVGSKEQARSIEQISKAIADMEQLTQKTAASAEESASAGEEMSGQSQEMKAAVAELVAVVGGGADSGSGNNTRKGRPRQRA
jgi:methyl-accepting chemotaxis protein/methyl-accepting chemotaxis protein-1 (serine sensor receptor)